MGRSQAAKEDINIQIMRILDDHNVSVAFPTRTVSLEHEDVLDGLPESGG